MKFIPDTPIYSQEDDALGRRNFAKELGNAIREWDRTESIVIALFGPWGSGKTSVLEMALESIRCSSTAEVASEAPIILRFNPWHFSGQGELLKMFFVQLYAQIRKVRPDLETELREKINSFATGLGLLESAPTVGPAFKLVSKALLGITTPEALEDQRAAIERVFKKLDRRIVIVLDDIDRLTDTEIRQLFQLIKLNADFSNTLYLVAFDRKVVIEALEAEQTISGKAYLEKIVQVAFDIPSVEKVRIEQFLFSKLDEIISTVPESNWDQERWGNLYHSGFKDIFISLRDVKRFVNSLSFTFEIVPAEVNPVDFIGLEALRVFFPEVYHGIARNKVLFTSTRWLGQNQRETEQRTEALNEIFQNEYSQPQIEIARSIALQLFPPIQSYYGGSLYASDYIRRWRQERRVCSEDIFDIYFLLGVPRGEISRNEMSEIMRSTQSAPALLVHFEELRQQDRMYRFLSLAEDEIDNLNPEQLRGFVEALVETGDSLPDFKQGFFDVGSDLQISRLIYLSLMRINESERFDFFASLIDQSDALFPPVFVVGMDSHSDDGRRREFPLFSEESLQDLQTRCARKIGSWAEDNRLLTTKRLAFLIYRWRRWGEDPIVVEEYISNVTSTTEGLLRLLIGFAHEVHSHTLGDYVSRKEFEINLSNLSEFVDLHMVDEILDGLSEDEINSLSDEENSAIEAFRNAYDQWLETNPPA